MAERPARWDATGIQQGAALHEGTVVGTATTFAGGALFAIGRAEAALGRHAADTLAVGDPMLAASILAMRTIGNPAPVSPLLSYLLRREQIADRDDFRRFPWLLSIQADAGDPAYGGRMANWHPREAFWLQSNPGQYAARIMAPALLGIHLQLWSEVAVGSDPTLAARATTLLRRALPVAEDDVAEWIAADDPWRDTFAIWQLSANPLALTHVRDLVQALASRYGRLAVRNGAIHGRRFPFFAEPLTSASAQLALGLWRLGTYPRVLPGLFALTKAMRRPDGSWQDGQQPPDVLTTLAAAELLTALDPTFDPEPTIRYFARVQEPAGWWRALSPEVPWLTAAIVDWLRRSTAAFTRRFAWPHVAPSVRDRLTGLPTIAFFDDIALAVAGLPELSQLPVEFAFIDLAGFGKFNTANGQVAGDRALRLYAETLREIPDALVVRDGGDEILVIGVPTAGVLERQLEEFMRVWPERAARLGIRPGGVVPRVVISTTTLADLSEARYRLGVAIGFLKGEDPDPGPTGVMRRI